MTTPVWKLIRAGWTTFWSVNRVKIEITTRASSESLSIALTRAPRSKGLLAFLSGIKNDQIELGLPERQVNVGHDMSNLDLTR